MFEMSKLLTTNRVCTILALVIILMGVTIYVLYTPQKAYEALIDIHVPEYVLGKVFQNDATILFKLGSRHLGGEGEYNLEKAAHFFDQALALDDSVEYLHYQRARIYFLTMQYRKALDEVNREIVKNPDFSRTYYLRGLIYGYDKKLPEAASDFEEFINREPDEWAGYNDLAWILFQLGDYQGVRIAMERILETTRNAWLLNAYGVALLNLDELESALSVFIEAKDLAGRMSHEEWGTAYIGNDPRIYQIGLEEMQKNIEENITIVNNRLSKK